MTEDDGHFIGAIMAVLATIAAWAGLLLWYFQEDTAFMLLGFFFNPWTSIFVIVVAATVIAAAFGGSALGISLIRHLKKPPGQS